MCSFPRRWTATSLVLAFTLPGVMALAAPTYQGIGRAATPREVAAWDIDVRPDFKGLPAGAGSVAKGQEIWEARCSGCHGVFGEATHMFSPLVGGTTAEDIRTGRVASLKDGSFPGRTTLMKVSSLSSLWDYIRRAMPWQQPKSLTTDEVYAVTAYLLNLGGIVPDDFVLSDGNIREVQTRMPNRNGMTTEHSLWPGKEFSSVTSPDIHAQACMKNCDAAGKVASYIPDFARNAHGNLAQQNRLVGPQHGVDTSGAAAQAANTPPQAMAATEAGSGANKAAMLVQKYGCVGCHAMNSRIIGPSFKEIAGKHAGKADYLAGKIQAGSTGVWGAMQMPPQPLNGSDARAIASWLADGAKP